MKQRIFEPRLFSCFAVSVIDLPPSSQSRNTYENVAKWAFSAQMQDLNRNSQIENGGWLPDMDLNHDKQIQSLLCYRYTIGQTGGLKVDAPARESSRQTAVRGLAPRFHASRITHHAPRITHHSSR
jgi:hypothetical protein